MKTIDDWFRTYERILRKSVWGSTSLQLTAAQQRCKYPGTRSLVRHAVWMCREAIRLEDANKRVRWLCWVQGVLSALGLRSIAQLRADTKEIL